MNRDDFRQLAIAAGWTPGTRPTPAQRLAIANALRTRLTAAELAAARVDYTQSPTPMPLKDAVMALLEEIN